jgi:hypothetical protein
MHPINHAATTVADIPVSAALRTPTDRLTRRIGLVRSPFPPHVRVRQIFSCLSDHPRAVTTAAVAPYAGTRVMHCCVPSPSPVGGPEVWVPHKS